MMHEVLKGIVEYQRDYLKPNNNHELDLKLKPLHRKELAKTQDYRYHGKPATGRNGYGFRDPDSGKDFSAAEKKGNRGSQ